MMKEKLIQLVKRGQCARTFLFEGEKSAREAALFFAREIVAAQKEHHPDIHEYLPQGKLGLHSIASIQAFLTQASMPSYESKGSVFILYDAHKMLPDSANALLKTLEEPLLKTTIILTAPSKEKLLPTLLSRCWLLSFKEEEKREPSLLTEKLLTILQKIPPYSELLHAIKEIADALEKEKKRLEKEHVPDKNLSLVQIEAAQKEVEGAIFFKIHEQHEMLLDTFIKWYRDLHLLHFQVDSKHLFFPHHQEESAFIPALFFVEEEIQQAKLALERSTPFSLVLENLILKLAYPVNI